MLLRSPTSQNTGFMRRERRRHKARYAGYAGSIAWQGRGAVWGRDLNYPAMEVRGYLVGKTEPLKLSEEELCFQEIKRMQKNTEGGEEEGLVGRLGGKRSCRLDSGQRPWGTKTEGTDAEKCQEEAQRRT